MAKMPEEFRCRIVCEVLIPAKHVLGSDSANIEVTETTLKKASRFMKKVSKLSARYGYTMEVRSDL